MAERFPPPTWPDGAVPTTTQLREWVRRFPLDGSTGGHDARVAADMVIGMLGEAQARIRDLEATIEATDLVFAELDDETRGKLYDAVRVARAARQVG